jgi:hypothetical protein
MRCPPCNASGVKPGYSTTPCELCKGVGQLPDDRLNNPPCAFCIGSGIKPGYASILCPVCQGWGRLADEVLGRTGPARRHPAVLSTLRQSLSKIASQYSRDFIEEAIGCAEAKFYRAAIILNWVGAIRMLQEHVVANHLAPFNTEAARRDSKWRPAKTTDDLSRMKEHEFLQILEGMSIIGKSVKAELEGCLTLRNSCGHPSSLQVSENRTAAHIETLVLNVFSMFT